MKKFSPQEYVKYRLLAINKEIENAINSTEEFIVWLEEESPKKTGPSGIGKENYTWYQKNVHLLPMTWEDEVRLLQRELDRAWASLKLEEHNNRNLPELSPANSPEDFKKLTSYEIPPSTLIICPVTNDESSDAKNKAVLAISSSTPSLFIGMLLRMFFLPILGTNCFIILVSIYRVMPSRDEVKITYRFLKKLEINSL